MTLSYSIRSAVLAFGIAWLPLQADEPNQVALEAVRRLKGTDLSVNPGLKRALEKVVDDFKGRGAMVELIRDFDLKERVPDLVAYLRQHPGDEAALEAVQYLASANPNVLKEELRSSGASPELLATLGRSGRSEWTGELVKIVVAKDRSAPQREAAVIALLATEDGAEGLVRILVADGLSGELGTMAVQGLQKSRWPRIRAAASGFDRSDRRDRDGGRVPRERVMQMRGDPARGSVVFRRAATGCIGCHQVGREGIGLGPNLGEIGAKLGKEALYDAIVDPSAGISFGYEAWLLTLRDGEEVLGLIASETDGEVALRMAGGQVLRYRKSEILKREKQAQSIMPAGLQDTMASEDFADLLAYLLSLKPQVP